MRAIPVAGIAKVSNTLTDTVGKLNFAPRRRPGRAVEYASMVLRGGYGLFYDRLSNQLGLLESLSLPNYVRSDSINTSKGSGYNLASSLANPFPTLPQRNQFPVLPVIYSSTAVNAPTPIAINDIDPRITYAVLPAVRSAAADGAFARHPVAGRAMSASNGHHLPSETEINQALIASPTAPVNGITTNNTGANDTAVARAPYQGFSNTGLVFAQTNQSSNFNAVQTTLDRAHQAARRSPQRTCIRKASIRLPAPATDRCSRRLPATRPIRSRRTGPSDFNRTHVAKLRLVRSRLPVLLPFKFATARAWVAGSLGDTKFSAIGHPPDRDRALTSLSTARRGLLWNGHVPRQLRAGVQRTLRRGADTPAGPRDRLGAYYNSWLSSSAPGNVYGNVSRNTLTGPRPAQSSTFRLPSSFSFVTT